MRAQMLQRAIVHRKITNIAMTLFAVVGIGMLVRGGFLAKSTLDFSAVAESAEGQVVDVEYHRSTKHRSYHPVVRFRSANGEEINFTFEDARRPSIYSRGDVVTVLYDPQAPHGARIDSFLQLWFGATSLGIMGGVLSGVGIGYWGWKVRRTRQDAWLDRHGERISARIVDIWPDTDYSISRQGRHPWRIRAQWQDPMAQVVYVFNSRNLWFDPAPFLRDKNIDVIIDRRNPGRYKIDLSLLPQEAG